MNARPDDFPLAAALPTSDLDGLMRTLGQQARAAAALLATVSREAKDSALRSAAARLRAATAAILHANAADLQAMTLGDASPAMIDRATLNPERVEAMAASLETIADLPDPVGSVIAEWDRPNGLRVQRVRTPLGVIGVIFESRPNVTADAGALCLKAGNAVILRGGSDTSRSAAAIHRCLLAGLAEAGLPEHAIQLVPTTDRAAVGAMLRGLDGALDVIVPRGGKGLVARVQEEARVPVFAHLEGVVHVYVHAPCDLEMAKKIVVNAKMRRTGICGAAETLLVDRALAGSHLQPLVTALQEAGCSVRGDATTRATAAGVEPASEDDWTAEYLDAVIAVRVVDGLQEAMRHVSTYGSHHTDAILTNDTAAAELFLAGLIRRSCS
jgi:glutamate-5-semialdehyde dehydrogenase